MKSMSSKTHLKLPQRFGGPVVSARMDNNSFALGKNWTVHGIESSIFQFRRSTFSELFLIQGTLKSNNVKRLIEKMGAGAQSTSSIRVVTCEILNCIQWCRTMLNLIKCAGRESEVLSDTNDSFSSEYILDQAACKTYKLHRFREYRTP